VPHAYELHVEVTATCLCCRAPRTFVFASPTDQVVCASCVAHLGSDKSERRDLQHVAMWADLYADQRINHEAEVEGLSATIAADAETVAALRDQVAGWTAVAAGEFAASPSSGVRELVETEVLARSARSVELLQRRIDRLMVALWKIEALHHDKPGAPGSCTCGKLLVACGETRALEPERQALRDWESKNAALARDGRRHALPTEHPQSAQKPARR
jgi:hypothetical protein